MKTKVLEGVLAIFKKKGVRFTMDDLASELSMSKKTLYRIFPDKSAMLMELLEYVFDLTNQKRSRIYNDPSLRSDEKFYRIICCLPNGMREINLTELYKTKKRYPEHWDRLKKYVDEDWDTTVRALNDAIADGYLRPINDQLLRIAYGAAVERFLTGDDLEKVGVSFAEALEKFANVLVEGIRA